MVSIPTPTADPRIDRILEKLDTMENRIVELEEATPKSSGGSCVAGVGGAGVVSLSWVLLGFFLPGMALARYWRR